MNIKNNKLQKLKEKLDKKKKGFLTESTKTFHQTIKEVFNENEHLEKIEWLQYIPYFNDGDVCEFAVYDPEFTYIVKGNEDLLIQKYKEKYGVNGVTFGWSEDEKGKWVKKEQPDSWILERIKHDVPNNKRLGTQLFTDLINFITSERELMESIFGSHARVIITRDDIKVEEYEEHD